MDTPSHIAYADESHYNVGRFRGIGLLSLPTSFVTSSISDLWEILRHSGVKELKWSKLNGAKARLAVVRALDWAVSKVIQGRMRLDVLVWDIQDRRHQVRNRDDIANLQRLYFRLFEHVLRTRWPDGSTWALYPDENTAMNWSAIENYLDMVGSRMVARRELFRIRCKTNFGSEKSHPVGPIRSPSSKLLMLS